MPPRPWLVSSPGLRPRCAAFAGSWVDVVRVGVLGAGGKMGTTVCRAVAAQPDMELVAAIDPGYAGIDFVQLTGVTVPGLQLSGDVSALKRAGVDVAIDFTTAQSAYLNMQYCADHAIRGVVGTTGLSDGQVEELRDRFAAKEVGCVIASNFAIGAVLMMKLAELVAPYFDTVEVVEIHHDAKIDAPSGTALRTAERVAEAKKRSGTSFSADPTKQGRVIGARGARMEGGVQVHSLRLRGAVAHQEVIFGTEGQLLTIRHDSYDRSSFMPGVLLAVRKVMSMKGLLIGIDDLVEDNGRF